ncbi:MAG: ADP-ribosylglycohydrolase family protein [Verrucomicrobiota bacterium]
MNDRIQNAMMGALVADAVSMPVHWYYDTSTLDRDYPDLESYRAPRNPHPDSILWRSKYQPLNKKGEILHDQAKFWGQRNVHYHQFLPAGDNTLNFRLGIELYRSVISAGGYDPDVWLARYVDRMRTPGWHSDTYVEEYHRAFFENVSRGHSLDQCGIKDIHIGGLTSVPFLLAALDALKEPEPQEDADLIEKHLGLTHRGEEIARSGRALTLVLYGVADGLSLRDSISEYGKAWVSIEKMNTWSCFEDRVVVGSHLTPACYLPDSFAASLYLAWKYHNDFSAGVIANARCGGDNAHRGAVVGSLLAAANEIPEHWLRDLKSIDRLRCDRLEPSINRI